MLELSGVGTHCRWPQRLRRLGGGAPAQVVDRQELEHGQQRLEAVRLRMECQVSAP